MKYIRRNYRPVSFTNFLSGSINEALFYRPAPVYRSVTGYNTEHVLVTTKKRTWNVRQDAKQSSFLLSHGYILHTKFSKFFKNVVQIVSNYGTTCISCISLTHVPIISSSAAVTVLQTTSISPSFNESSFFEYT